MCTMYKMYSSNNSHNDYLPKVLFIQSASVVKFIYNCEKNISSVLASHVTTKTRLAALQRKQHAIGVGQAELILGIVGEPLTAGSPLAAVAALVLAVLG